MVFIPSNKTEYTILRDYYVSNNHLQGIYFLLQDNKGNIITKFLGKELIKNNRLWKKKGTVFNRHYQMLRFDKSTTSTLVIEEGELKLSKGALKKAERISFNLKHN